LGASVGQAVGLGSGFDDVGAAATKNQLLGQLDRCFPGLTLALPDVLPTIVLGTMVGRPIADEFADPARLAALGAARFVRFAPPGADGHGAAVGRGCSRRAAHR
jgi:hypothetical protein